jgi:hypothetical protein
MTPEDRLPIVKRAAALEAILGAPIEYLAMRYTFAEVVALFRELRELDSQLAPRDTSQLR